MLVQSMPYPASAGGGGATWQTMRDTSAATPELIDNGYATFTVRQRFRPAGLIDIASATKCRYTFYAPLTGVKGMKFTSAYLGFAQHQTDVGLTTDQSVEFDGSQVQMLFSGSASPGIIAVGGSATSDDILLTPDGTQWLVSSWHFDSDTNNGAWSGVNNATLGGDAGSVGFSGDVASATAPTSGFGQTPQIAFRMKLEVFA